MLWCIIFSFIFWPSPIHPTGRFSQSAADFHVGPHPIRRHRPFCAVLSRLMRSVRYEFDVLFRRRKTVTGGGFRLWGTCVLYGWNCCVHYFGWCSSEGEIIICQFLKYQFFSIRFFSFLKYKQLIWGLMQIEASSATVSG